MFERANKWLLKRLEERRARNGRISLGDTGIQITRADGAELIAWQDIAEIKAILKDAYVGDNLGLVIEAGRAIPLTVMESDPGWTELTKAIGLYLPESVASPEWSLKTALTEREPMLVYRKPLP